MALIQLPQVIWQDVLFNWLGGLKEIVRIDCAYALRKPTTCSLLSVYATKSFPLDGEMFYSSDFVLTCLCRWMKSKTIYINHLTLLFDSLVPCPKPAIILQLVQNNASRLVSIVVDGPKANPFLGLVYVPSFPCLRVLQCTYSNNRTLFDLLGMCPCLTALNLAGYDTNCITLLSTIAGKCPLLQRLSLRGLRDLNDELLMLLCSGCPRIEYLGLCDCHYWVTPRFADVVRALPRLHTLMTNELPENVLLALAQRGAPSLRTLRVPTSFSYALLRQLTAALPQLTALAVYNIVGEPNCTELFQYCLNLEILHLCGCHNSELIASTALLSVATYCPNLQSLVLGPYVPYNHTAIDAVLNSCRKLRAVQVISQYADGETAGDPRLVFTASCPDLAVWMPTVGTGETE